ncbi:MAG: NTP transferase domain-containing protein [Gemmatimonadetes bacterium]|nr:NTP transferase domain-containing protein [Gemmatimonadota bacterium]
MIFAAGLGTRLRPLTDHAPKALIPVGGVPMLERVARRLVDAGADRLVINTHRHSEQIEAFVAERGGFGAEVVFSREPDRPLETGGGLLQAAALLRRDAPFLLHNVDVLTDLPLRELSAAQLAAGATVLATLAVMEREAARRLLFDDLGLCGRRDLRAGTVSWARSAVGSMRELPYCGVQAVSPRLLDLITERGVFSIFEPYLRLAGERWQILPYRVDGAAWFDIGDAQRLAAAEAGVANLGGDDVAGRA